MKNIKKENIFSFIILILAIIRGSSYIFIKNVIYSYSTFEIVFLRFFITGCILAFIFHKQLLKTNKFEIFIGFLAGLFIFLAFTFQTYGLQYTTISKQSFITSLYTIIVPILELIIFKKKLNKILNLSLLLITLGLFLISFRDLSNFHLDFNVGDFFTLLCAFAFAFNILLFSKIKKLELNVLNITVFQMLITGAFAFIFNYFIKNNTIHISFSYSMLYLIFICTLINFLLQNISQKYVSAHRTGLILSLESVFGTLFALFIFNEQLSINFIAGIFMIFLGIILVQFFEK